MKYEGNIGIYSFIMNESDVIEVWSESDLDRPESYIFIKGKPIENEKEFHKEISFWYMNRSL
jgi:hypothetical protein